jgi:hypothetical protein
MKRSTILLLLAISAATLVVAIFPPKLPVSEQAAREITEVVRRKEPTRQLAIRSVSVIGVRVEATDPTKKGSGSRIYYLRRSFSGWEITGTIFSIE